MHLSLFFFSLNKDDYDYEQTTRQSLPQPALTLWWPLCSRYIILENSKTQLSPDEMNPSFEFIVHPFFQLPDHEVEEGPQEEGGTRAREKWVSSDVNRRDQECRVLNCSGGWSWSVGLIVWRDVTFLNIFQYVLSLNVLNKQMFPAKEWTPWSIFSCK